MIEINNKKNIWNQIINITNSFENELDTQLKRQTGSYYTDLDLAYHIVDIMFSYCDEHFLIDIENKTFLEPCVGCGNFVFAYLRKISELNLNQNQILSILNNIYVADINLPALQLYKKLFKLFVNTYFDIDIHDDYFTNRIANGLSFDVSSEDNKYITMKDAFPTYNKKSFDIIMTNPPYKNLKAEKNKYSKESDFIKDQKRYAFISDVSKQILKNSSDGVLNLYKLFIEEILMQYSHREAMIALLIPSSILSDKTCFKLRTHILENFNLRQLELIPESNTFVNAQQALCTLIIDKSGKTKEIKICKNYCENSSELISVDINNIINAKTYNSIFALSQHEYSKLLKLRKFPTVDELDFIINMRGELDLTIHKGFITTSKTGHPLLRGKNISTFELKRDKEAEYVSRDFVSSCTKSKYIFKPRIACQQVANIHKEKRIIFSYVQENYVLGNSCNFISLEENKYNIDLFALLGLFNSTLINWYFKLTSSNNHVNNYEIDSFPVPVNSIYLKQISKLTQQYLKTNNSELLLEIDSLASKAYEIEDNSYSVSHNMNVLEFDQKLYEDLKYIIPNISFQDAQNLILGRFDISYLAAVDPILFDKITEQVCQGIVDKYRKLSKKEFLNHITFKLSDLDLEMVRCVPPGGNWKDISSEVIAKSKRLTTIAKNGGRTTLYGRLDYNKPSYTITTYFNRPGNGTYIHPSYDRVLSVREAARLQSFDDEYYFYGNKTDLLNQVGNAVPPTLAFHIGNRIIKEAKCRTSIDLFCGAGGMTSGFKKAGIQSVLGNDIDRSACITFKINNPRIETLHADITIPETKKHIIEIAKAHKVDIVCGGPPCQGFSHAGKRFLDDPRNQLFKDYIEVVQEIMPKIVVMENVEGMLTFNNGKTYQEIISSFNEIGYNAEGRKLMANHYGVPQKRKRVIIICTRKDLSLQPSALFPKPTTLDEKLQATTGDAIYDLESIPCEGQTLQSNKKFTKVQTIVPTSKQTTDILQLSLF